VAADLDPAVRRTIARGDMGETGRRRHVRSSTRVQHSVVAPPCSAETKLNTGAQIQNLLKKSFTACRPPVMANNAFRLGRIC